MYSRQNSTGRSTAPWQIPKNYSGNAFPPQQPSEECDDESSFQKDEDSPPESATVSASVCGESEKKSGIFGLSRKSGGIGIEELLILGLVLLISQSEEGEGNNDLAFLLLLLLFIQ